MTVLFGEGAEDTFRNLPRPVQVRAAKLLDLLGEYPEMFPVRRRGLMKGLRYFMAHRYLFYYSASSTEIRILAILPGQMRQA